jgi:hypothetical protein
MLAEYLVPYLTVYPLLFGFIALAIGAARREYMWRRKKVKHLAEEVEKKLAIPEHLKLVQTGNLERRAGLKFEGTMMLVAAGTPSLKRLLDTLILLDRAGLEDMVGSILAYECTNSSRADFLNRLPLVFRDRVVIGVARDFPNGFGNQPPDWVERRVGLWGVELENAVKAAVKLHEERNKGSLGQIIDFISLGGHVFPGVFMTQELNRLLPQSQIVGVVNLPRKTTQRRYFTTLKERYEHAGVVAWLVSDQMEPDWVTQDSVVGSLLATLCTASLSSDNGVAINNVITNAAGVGNIGGMVRFTYHYTDVVAHPYQVDTAGNVRYYVSQELVESELRKVIGEIESGQGAVSIDVPVQQHDVPVQQHDVHIHDIAAVQLDPQVTRNIRDAIERARDLEDRKLSHLDRPHRHPTVDYETIYSPWSLPIDPKHPRCRILVVRLQAIDAPLDLIVAAPAQRLKASDGGEDDAPATYNDGGEDDDPARLNGVASDYELEF